MSYRRKLFAITIISIQLIASITRADEIKNISEAIKKTAISSPEHTQAINEIKNFSCKSNHVSDSEISHFMSTGNPPNPDEEPYCEIDASTGCQNGIFNMPLQADGLWLWQISRYQYIDYMTSMANQFHVPLPYIAADLSSITKLIEESIKNKLKTTPRENTLKNSNSTLGLYINDKKYGERLGEIENHLSISWNNYRNSLPKQQRDLTPEMGYGLECGAGEVPVFVKSSPDNAKIEIISDYDWRVCEALNLDPWDTKKCLGWSRVATNPIYLSGKYNYIATWSDEHKEESDFELTFSAEPNCQILEVSKNKSVHISTIPGGTTCPLQ